MSVRFIALVGIVDGLLAICTEDRIDLSNPGSSSVTPLLIGANEYIALRKDGGLRLRKRGTGRSFWTRDDETHFMNVDLEVLSRRSLQPLAEGFDSRVMPLYVGSVGRNYAANFELSGSLKRDADAIIVALLRLITSLPRPARQAWRQAFRRDFNIGIQGGLRPRMFELSIKPQTLNLVRAVNARLVVTVYAAEPSVGPSQRVDSTPPRQKQPRNIRLRQ